MNKDESDSMYNTHGRMRGLPNIRNSKQALREIIKLANDKREHILFQDCIDWLNYKMRAIKTIAKCGLKK